MFVFRIRAQRYNNNKKIYLHTYKYVLYSVRQHKSPGNPLSVRVLLREDFAHLSSSLRNDSRRARTIVLSASRAVITTNSRFNSLQYGFFFFLMISFVRNYNNTTTVKCRYDILTTGGGQPRKKQINKYALPKIFLRRAPARHYAIDVRTQ